LKTKAVRIYGVKDLRLEEFELPAMGDDEIQARIVTDSLCMSTYKVANQGSKHKKLPENLEVLEQGAFFNCPALSGTIQLPESVTSIGKSAFKGCTGLERIYIPGSNLQNVSDAILWRGYWPILKEHRFQYKAG